MNIVFWGGCINRQQSITEDKHYHAIVRKAMEAETGIASETWLRFYSSFHGLKREAGALLQHDTQFDYLVIFIRPFTLMPLTRLLVRYTDKDMNERVSVNPRLSRFKFYDSMVSEFKTAAKTKGNVGLIHKTLRQLNDFAGDMLNLSQWAQNEVIRILEDIHVIASQNGTELVLVGPTLYPANKRISKSCVELNKKIASFASIHNIVHVDMAMSFDKNGNSLLEADGKHVTQAGHAFMAEGILKHLKMPMNVSHGVTEKKSEKYSVN